MISNLYCDVNKEEKQYLLQVNIYPNLTLCQVVFVVITGLK